MSDADLTLYYRVGCHLCEDFYHELLSLLAGAAYRVRTVDVDTDPTLRARYGDKVPVLCGRAGELCHYELDKIAVQAYLSSG